MQLIGNQSIANSLKTNRLQILYWKPMGYFHQSFFISTLWGTFTF